MAAIRDIEAKLFRVPLREVLVDAAHGDHTHFELVTVTITTEEGRAGTGYTYTGGKGGRAILAMVEHDLAPALRGADSACIEAVWNRGPIQYNKFSLSFSLKNYSSFGLTFPRRIKSSRIDSLEMSQDQNGILSRFQAILKAKNFLLNRAQSCQWGAHYVGRGGVLSFAISAVDIALWDLRCKKAGEPLWKMLGGGSGKGETRCYAGGIDLQFSISKLVESVGCYLAEGHNAVKIKVGKPDLAEDVERVAEVRKFMDRWPGPETTLMVDANMSWKPERAIRAAKAFKPFNILWLEEPTIPDDFEGYRRIRERGGVALAQGENLHTVHEFMHALCAGGVDFPQPDASNVGGVTGWMKVARLAEAHNLAVSSHGMQELHVSLLSAVTNQGWMECHSFPIDEYTVGGKVRVIGGKAKAPSAAGIGVEFDWAKLDPHRVPPN